MKELRSKILEALISALPITLIVYLMSLLPWFNFNAPELITFTIGAVFLVCQVIFLKLPKRQLMRIGVGVVFTYIGLVIFLTGVNVGFMPIGYKLGHAMEAFPMASSLAWVL